MPHKPSLVESDGALSFPRSMMFKPVTKRGSHLPTSTVLCIYTRQSGGLRTTRLRGLLRALGPLGSDGMVSLDGLVVGRAKHMSIRMRYAQSPSQQLPCSGERFVFEEC